MPTAVIYPKVSVDTSTGRISRWRVSEGDRVSAGQVLFEIDNDKAAVEVAAPADGIIRGLTSEAEEVETGDPVATILAEGESYEAAATRLSPGASPGRQSEQSQASLHGSRRDGAPLPTPLARRIARDSGIILDGLTGTGPGGRVQKKDVLALMAARSGDAPEIVSGNAPLLHAEWLRKGPGRAVVLIHGFSGDLNNWRAFAGSSRMDAPMLALDLPGHGRSPRAIPENLDGIAAQVEATLYHHGVESPVIAGHSFGALVAARAAARATIDIRGLALFAPAGLSPAINDTFIQGMLRASSAESLKPWLEELVEDPALISDVVLRLAAEARRDAGLVDAMRRFAHVFMPDGTQRYGILADLDRISVPVRVIFGRNDRILPFGDTARLPAHVALHAIPRCGHMPHLEHPALSQRILAEILSSAR